jgi:hypothetical protein
VEFREVRRGDVLAVGFEEGVQVRVEEEIRAFHIGGYRP